jgi:hypothetical protein
VTIEEAITAKLKTVLGHQRVFPDVIPDTNVKAAQWPCVVYTHSSDDDLIALDESARPMDHSDSYTLAIWGPDRLAVVQTRNTIKQAFAGANCQGVWGGESGVYVAGATAMNAAATLDPASDGGEDHMRAETLILKVFWYGN